uniref:Transposase n=1 Tax=Heterorhabditis bacteriophora TaxID=37862 RepID=A0A1I7XSC5_HETBA
MNLGNKNLQKNERGTVEGYLEQLQIEVKHDIEELLKTLPDSWTKEQIRIRIKEHIQGGGYLPRIKNKIEVEMANNWVSDELGEDVEKKVRSSYGLSDDKDKCEVINEQEGESPILDVIG